jgi:hypothetical protein
MENILKSVLEAKRFFIAAQQPTEEVIQTYQITEEEILFWFQTMYPERIKEAEQAIKYWKEKQILL